MHSKLPKNKTTTDLAMNSINKQTNLLNVNNQIIKEIAKLANNNGFEIYIVGGYVRDKLLNKSRQDYDLSVIGDAIALAKIIATHYHNKAVIFPKFKTAMIPIGDLKIELVGTRKEEYKPNSRKPIVFDAPLEEDLKRRDFTINAMAINLNSNSFGELIDLFDGLDDLKNRIIRTPLEPEITFSDDPLRMLRAIRFSAQLNFIIENNCLEAITKMAERINIISQERISDEFLKILQSDNPAKGIELLHKTGLLKIIFPELSNLEGVEIVYEGNIGRGHKDVFNHTLKVLENISKITDNFWLRFAALVHDIAKPKTKKFIEGIGWTFYGHEELGARWMEKIFRRMKFPLDKLDYAQRLIRLHQRPMALVEDKVTDSAIRRLAFYAGDALEDLFVLCRADITTKNPNLSRKYFDNYEKVARKVIEIQEKDKLREFQSPVRGDEIMKICNLEPSKAVGFIKSTIEEAILDGIIPNEYESAKKYMLENLDKWMKIIEQRSLRKYKSKKK